jgi:hypothetical protein
MSTRPVLSRVRITRTFFRRGECSLCSKSSVGELPTPEARRSGTVEQWNSGTVEQWNSGTTVRAGSKPVVQGNSTGAISDVENIPCPQLCAPALDAGLPQNEEMRHIDISTLLECDITTLPRQCAGAHRLLCQMLRSATCAYPAGFWRDENESTDPCSRARNWAGAMTDLMVYPGPSSWPRTPDSGIEDPDRWRSRSMQALPMKA